MRRVSKTDGNQRAIVDALRAAGCGVVDLSAVGGGVPDLFVCGPAWPFECRLLEVKNLKGRGNKLTPAQMVFHASWRGGIAVVETPAQALDAMGLK